MKTPENITVGIMLVVEVLLAMFWLDGYALAGTAYQIYLWAVSGLYVSFILGLLGFMAYDKTIVNDIRISPINYWYLVWSMIIQTLRILFLVYMGLLWLPVVLAICMVLQVVIGSVVRRTAINSRNQHE